MVLRNDKHRSKNKRENESKIEHVDGLMLLEIINSSYFVM